MKEWIYLDNSATTALSKEAKAAMCAAMEVFGNPSSLHGAGSEAASALRTARKTVGEALGERFLRDGQLIFTSCGSEANALALLGTAHAKERREAKTILTTDSEHPSVEENMKRLEREGFLVVRVPTRGGVLDPLVLQKHYTKNLFMVSMMLVNNETGARYPLEEVFREAKAASPSCICHADAVQGFLKLPMTAKSLGADLISISSHKVHGPKGVGALYIAPQTLKAKKIAAVLLGGGQEFGLRSGTENTLGIAGFAAAVAAEAQGLAQNIKKMSELSAYLVAELERRGIRVNLPPVRAPHIVNFTLPNLKSETVLHALSAKGIAVSAGSACSSHAKAPSATLLSFGLTPDEAASSLRVSLCGENRKEDIDTLLSALDEARERLVRIHR